MQFTSLLSLFGNLEQLDRIRINFDRESVNLMNLAIAFIMFGVALSIKPQHFRALLLNPKPMLLGVVAQYVLLPALTFALVIVLRPSTAVAMGMILVAACPGGNVSNLISSISRSNITLSVSLTAITTVMSLFMTPFNFAFWGGLYARHSPLLVPITINPAEMFRTVFLILGIPVIVGMFVGMKFPKFTQRVDKPVQAASIIFFVGFIAAALAGNFHLFLRYIHLIFFLVLIHNGMAFLSGYFLPKSLKVNELNCRTIS
ncbi:MAG: bile acid:sodium symporter family protein, partial [Proteiniphilum sp.]|nr:bile acid:sodium symporter family protein [Proteiniphilum sp.]